MNGLRIALLQLIAAECELMADRLRTGSPTPEAVVALYGRIRRWLAKLEELP